MSEKVTEPQEMEDEVLDDVTDEAVDDAEQDDYDRQFAEGFGDDEDDGSSPEGSSAETDTEDVTDTEDDTTAKEPPADEGASDGGELLAAIEERARALQESIKARPAPAQQPDKPGQPEPPPAQPNAPSTVVGDLDFSRLPQEVRIGQRIVSPKEVYDKALKDYGEDDPMVGLVAAMLKGMEQQAEQKLPPGAVSAEEFRRYQETIEQRLAQAAYDQFVARVARKAGPEVYDLDEMDSEQSKDFDEFLKRQSKGVQFVWDTAVRTQNVDDTASIINLWKEEKAKAAAKQVDEQRLRERSRKQNLHSRSLTQTRNPAPDGGTANLEDEWNSGWALAGEAEANGY